MTPCSRPVTSPLLYRKDGFVILAVLGLTALVSALAVGLLYLARHDYREVVLRRDRAQAIIVADNALVRAIAAIAGPGEPAPGPALRLNEPIRLDENDIEVVVEIEPESGKIDINRADARFIRNGLLRAGLAAPDADLALDHVRDARMAERFIHEPQAILPAALSYDPVAGSITRLFTTATGSAGISTTFARKEVLDAIPDISPEESAALRLGLSRGGEGASTARMKLRNFLAPPRPIYTFRARIAQGTLPPVRRSVGVAFLNLPVRRRQDVAILWWRSENY